MRAHLKARNIANVAIDVDSRDFLTRNPSVMRRNVMSQLAKKGRGIILFHDIQPATAGGLRALLDELKEKEYRVVHMVPKGSIETLPKFDAIAEREAQRRKVGLSGQPLANRSAMWPMTAGEPKRLPWVTDPPPPSTTIKPALQPLPLRTAKPKVRPYLNKDDWATNPLGQP